VIYEYSYFTRPDSAQVAPVYLSVLFGVPCSAQSSRAEPSRAELSRAEPSPGERRSAGRLFPPQGAHVCTAPPPSPVVPAAWRSRRSTAPSGQVFPASQPASQRAAENLRPLWPPKANLFLAAKLSPAPELRGSGSGLGGHFRRTRFKGTAFTVDSSRLLGLPKAKPKIPPYELKTRPLPSKTVQTKQAFV